MKHKAVIVQRLSENNFEKIKEITYKEKDKTVTFKDHEYPIPDKPVHTLIDKNTTYIFFEINSDSATVLTFKEIDLGVDTKMLWRLTRQNMLGTLLSRIKAGMEESPQKWKIIQTIIMCGMSGLIGYLIGSGGLSF